MVEMKLSLEFFQILGRVGLELFDAWFAAEFDLLAIVDFDDLAAHAVEIVVGDDAGFERVGFGFRGGLSCYGGGLRRVRGSAGSECEADEGGGEQCV